MIGQYVLYLDLCAVAFFMLLSACSIIEPHHPPARRPGGPRKSASEGDGLPRQLIAPFLANPVLTAFCSLLLSFGLVILLFPSSIPLSGKVF